MDNSRKKFLQQLGAAAVFTSFPVAGFGNDTGETRIDVEDFMEEGAPNDEKFWKKIARKYYEVARDHINLENGYYGIQPKTVLEAFQKNVITANVNAAKFARKEFPALSADIKKQLAEFLGVSDEEIIITRNATEALNIAIQGYPFRQDDEVLVNQLDYFSMIETFRMLEKRGIIKVNTFDMPLQPASDDEIVEVYRKQLTPKTRVILLTQVSNINGLIIPVAKIASLAREKNIGTITDSAHALGHIPFSLPPLGSDLIGLNLHKWIGNPVGAGVLYVRKERIREMKPMFGDVNTAETDIEKLAHFGTTPFAVIMTIPNSLSFQKMMGVERVSARLKYLSDTWMNGLKNNPAVEIVTPPGPLSCAIGSFRVKDKPSSEIADQLFKQHNILTVSRTLNKQGCVRVTPSVYNSIDDIHKLVAAINIITS